MGSPAEGSGMTTTSGGVLHGAGSVVEVDRLLTDPERRRLHEKMEREGTLSRDDMEAVFADAERWRKLTVGLSISLDLTQTSAVTTRMWAYIHDRIRLEDCWCEACHAARTALWGDAWWDAKGRGGG